MVINEQKFDEIVSDLPSLIKRTGLGSYDMVAKNVVREYDPNIPISEMLFHCAAMRVMNKYPRCLQNGTYVRQVASLYIEMINIELT